MGYVRAITISRTRQELVVRSSGIGYSMLSHADNNLSTLTRSELAELLFDQIGLNKSEAIDMVDAFFDEIRSALERGDNVKLSGFGNFQLRDKPQRPGRNLKTGAVVLVAARRVVTFRPSQMLKSKLK